MAHGCLFELGRWIVRGCLRLGAMLASVLMATVGFLLFGVVGPVGLGMTGEVIRRLAGGRRGGRETDPSPLPGNVLACAVLGGTLWTVGSIVVVGLLRLISTYLVPLLPVAHRSTIAICLVFTTGAVVGVLASRYERANPSGW